MPLALRHLALLRPLPLWRLAAAVFVLGSALAGAALLHWHRFVYSCPPDSLGLCGYTKTPAWVNPTALAICFLGVAAAAGVLLTARQNDS
jgi:hypothetical protein